MFVLSMTLCCQGECPEQLQAWRKEIEHFELDLAARSILQPEGNEK